MFEDDDLDEIGFMADDISASARKSMQEDIAEISQRLGFNPAQNLGSQGANEALYQTGNGGDPFMQDSIPIVVLSKEHLEELRRKKKMAAYERKQRKEMKRRRQEWLLRQRQQHQETKQMRRSGGGRNSGASAGRRSWRLRQQQQQQQQWQYQQQQSMDRLGFRPRGYNDEQPSFVDRYRGVSQMPTSMPSEVKALGPRHPLYRQWKQYLQEVKRQRESVAHDGRAIVRSGRSTAATPFVKDLGANAPTAKQMARGTLTMRDMTVKEREEVFEEFKAVTTANRGCLVSTKDQCMAQRNREIRDDNPDVGPCYWDEELTFCFPTRDTVNESNKQLFQPNLDSETGAAEDTPEFKANRVRLLKDIQENPTYLLRQLLAAYMYELAKYPYKNMLDQYAIIRANDCLANAMNGKGGKKKMNEGMQLLRVLKSNVYMRTNMMMFCDGRREEGCIAACDFHPAQWSTRWYKGGSCKVKGSKKLTVVESALESIKNSMTFVKKFLSKYMNIGLLFSGVACMYAVYRLYKESKDVGVMDDVEERFVSDSNMSFTFLDSMLHQSDEVRAAMYANTLQKMAEESSTGDSMQSAMHVIVSVVALVLPFAASKNLPATLKPLATFLKDNAANLFKLSGVLTTLISYFPAATASVTSTFSGWFAAATTYLGASVGMLNAWAILPVLLTLAIIYFGYKFYKRSDGGDKIINASIALNTVSIAAQLNIDIEQGWTQRDAGAKIEGGSPANPQLAERVEYPTMRAVAERMNAILVEHGVNVSGLVEQYEYNMRFEKRTDLLRESFESLSVLIDAENLRNKSVEDVRRKLQKTFNNGHFNSVNDEFSGFLSEDCNGAEVDTSALNKVLQEEMDDEGMVD